MIKGQGTLQVSEATIMAAVQEYLDRRLAEGMHVEVTGIKWSTESTGMTNTFSVSIKEKEVAM